MAKTENTIIVTRDDLKIMNVHMIQQKGRRQKEPDVIFFNMRFFDAVTIYGCKLCRSKAGDWFVSMPAKKASNGEWYNDADVYWKVCEFTQDNVIDMVFKILDEEE